MKKNTLIFLILVCCILFPSCASIFTKSSYPIAINSEPEGAKVTIVNRKGETVYTGKTPATVTLDPSSKYMSGEKLVVTISKAGYQEQKVYINSKIEGWYWANILLGGLIGMLVIDPLTGAMYKLDTKAVDVTLEKDGDDNNMTLQIIDINTLSEGQKEDLVKLN